MNDLIQFLKQVEGTLLTNKDGLTDHVKLLPPLGEQEVAAIEAKLPGPMPPDIRELLAFASGFDGTWLEEVKFASDPGEFGLEEVFPFAFSLAGDGLGNFWIIDLTKDSKTWGPIFFACHDAPVVVYQAPDLLHFVQEVIRDGNPPWKSEISEVLGPLTNRIWGQNPGVLSFAECQNSADEEIKKFVKTLDDSWEIIDLRSAKLGDGFSWGRYGGKTVVRRFGDKRIFAYQKKSAGRRMWDFLR